MSDLQLSLIVLGALVIGAVYVFNRLQERRYRAQAEEVFRRDHPDVLLEGRDAATPGPAGAAAEAEPLITRAKRAAEPIEPSLRLEPLQPSAPIEPRIHAIAALRAAAGNTVSAAQLSAALEQFPFTPKPLRWQGKNLSDEPWEDINLAGAGNYNSLQVGMQLANRGGAVSASDLESFIGMVKNVGARLNLTADLPDKQAVLQRAQELDAFCAQVDVLMDFSVVCKDGAAISATKVRALAEAEGMTLRPDGVFVARSEHGEDVFTLSNQEPRPFLPDQIRAITTHAVVFSLDVPRVKDVVKGLSRMTHAAQSFAHGIGGVVVDERRRELKDTQIQHIRNQLQQIVTTMAKHQIPSGSPLAQQLFAE